MSMITIKTEDGVAVHIASADGNDYATVCGQALDGDQYCGEEIPTLRGAKITCGACRNAWNACRGLTLRNFSLATN